MISVQALSELEKKRLIPGNVRPRGAPLLRSLLWKVAVNGLLPVAVFALISRHVPSQAIALALAGAIPVGRIVMQMIRKRRIDPIGAIAAGGFAGACLVSLLAKGNPLVLRLHGAAISGAIGTFLLLSAIGRRPMIFSVAVRLAGNDARFRALLDKLTPDTDGVRPLRTVTVIVGITLLIEALAHVAVALSASTRTYFILSRMVDWSIRGIGALTLIVYLKYLRSRASRPAQKQSSL